MESKYNHLKYKSKPKATISTPIPNDYYYYYYYRALLANYSVIINIIINTIINTTTQIITFPILYKQSTL